MLSSSWTAFEPTYGVLTRKFCSAREHNSQTLENKGPQEPTQILAIIRDELTNKGLGGLVANWVGNPSAVEPLASNNITDQS